MKGLVQVIETLLEFGVWTAHGSGGVEPRRLAWCGGSVDRPNSKFGVRAAHLDARYDASLVADLSEVHGKARVEIGKRKPGAHGVWQPARFGVTHRNLHMAPVVLRSWRSLSERPFIRESARGIGAFGRLDAGRSRRSRTRGEARPGPTI